MDPSTYAGLTAVERKLIYKREETNLKRACTKLLKDNGGYSLPIPGGPYSINGSPDRICFYQARAVCIEFKRQGQKLSRAQAEMELNITATGCEYYVVRSEKDFILAMGLPINRLF